MERIKLTKDLCNKLFVVIRSGLDIDNFVVQFSDEDFDMLFLIAKQQSIQPIVYRGLKKLGVSERLIGTFDKERIKDTSQYILQRDVLEKICSVMDNAQIPYIPLKGSVLRQLYPAPELRTCVDIDVLVRECDLDKAVKNIEDYTDLKYRKRNYHDVLLTNSKVSLELHFSIKEGVHRLDKLLDSVWDFAVYSVGYKYTLTPEFQIFHVVAHMCYHMINGGLGIRPFLDLWLLVNKTSFDEKKINHLLSECELLTFYEKCNELVNSWMSGQPVPEDLMVLEEYALNGGVFGSKENALAAKQRKHRGIKYIYNRVFKTRNQLINEHPELREKPYLLPICQFKRWLQLLNYKKRRQISSEIRSVNSMNKKTIEAFDSLLKSVGL